MRIPIVNEQDEIIGEEERSIIHQKGLLHREAHVIFVTKDLKIIFQKRGLSKDTYPGLLDFTVGGHVDNQYDSYEQTAERESIEETGIDVKGKLIFLDKLKKVGTYDKITKNINSAFDGFFYFQYQGELKDLKCEPLEGMGFKAYSISELKNLSELQKKKFIPRSISKEFINLYERIISKIICK